MKEKVRNKFIKIISITFLVLGGCVFLMSVPKIFSTVLVKTIEFLDDSPKIDSNGRTIYEDGRNTIMSFGARKEFEIVKSASGKYNQFTPPGTRWCLFDRDNNKSIEPDIEGYHCSPCIYKKGGKGYECASSYVYTKLSASNSTIQPWLCTLSMHDTML